MLGNISRRQTWKTQHTHASCRVVAVLLHYRSAMTWKAAARLTHQTCRTLHEEEDSMHRLICFQHPRASWASHNNSTDTAKEAKPCCIHSHRSASSPSSSSRVNFRFLLSATLMSSMMALLIAERFHRTAASAKLCPSRLAAAQKAW